MTVGCLGCCRPDFLDASLSAPACTERSSCAVIAVAAQGALMLAILEIDS